MIIDFVPSRAAMLLWMNNNYGKIDPTTAQAISMMPDKRVYEMWKEAVEFVRSKGLLK